MVSKDGEVTYDNALARLAEGLLADKKYNVGSFKDFFMFCLRILLNKGQKPLI